MIPLALGSNTEGEHLGRRNLPRELLRTVSISELAQLSGVSERMLRGLRQGTRRPSAATLEVITEALVRILDDLPIEET